MFFDLKKAFDSIPHQSLVDKLHSYGLDINTLAWIYSYLTNRKQHVFYCSASSVGPGRLCQHTFKHNRLSILVRIIMV